MPSALWVGYPKSYTKGRTRKPQLIVLHYTAGAEGPSSAENGAAYDKRRTDGTSTHYFTDSLGPALQEVPVGDRAHAARYHGNEMGIQIEICGTLQSRAQWLDAVSAPTLDTTAWLVADLIKSQGIKFQRLTTAQVKAGWANKNISGICDHGNITQAFPEDQGDHMDVGSAFPWDVFMPSVARYLGGGEVMAKLVQINDGPAGNGAVYGTSGTARMGFGGADPWGSAQAWAAFWGAPTTNLQVVKWADADRLLGPDTGTMVNTGDSGGAVGPVPDHEHSGGATGGVIRS